MPDCAALVPAFLLQETPPVDAPVSAKLPDGHDDARPWQEGFVGQTGQLEVANLKPPAVDHIYRTCLQMHRDALKRSQRGLIGRIFGNNEPRWMGVRLDPKRYAPG